jgi:pyridoxamine 5'-phosphate oxidase
LEDRAAFEARVQELKQQYEGQDVPRPPYWTGNRVVPSSIEFWLDMPYRLHDRTVFERVGDGWQSYKLYP